jgi:hypothetical protein
MSLIPVLAWVGARRAVVVTALLAGGLACDRAPRTPAANDTAAPEAPAEESAAGVPAPVSMHGWRVAEAGRALVVSAPASALRAQLVFPQYTDSTLTTATRFDAAPLEGEAVDLYGPAGLVGQATLDDVGPPAPRAPAAGSGSADACTGWPQARVLPATEPLSPWRVGFARGMARPLPLDSAFARAGPDSALLAAAVARLASGLPQDTASLYRGLPFVVRDVRRFSPTDGVEALVADVVRRVNQEATQHMEHLLLVAERDAGRPDAPWAVAYHERTAGPEETLEMSEVLAAVTLGMSNRPTLVVARDSGDGMVYALVERVARGRWAVRWSSAYAGC